ncbi:hypothetical protein JCM18899A_32630 [Nocardioides sp. AN3]
MNARTCLVCGGALTGRQRKWCSKAHSLKGQRAATPTVPYGAHGRVPALASWAAVVDELEAMVALWPDDIAALEAAGVSDDFLGDLECHWSGAAQVLAFVRTHAPGLTADPTQPDLTEEKN